MTISLKTMIGAGLGWAFMGPLGAIIGGMIGSKLEDSSLRLGSGQAGSGNSTKAGDFYASLIIVLSHIIKADNHVRRDEIEYVRNYLNKSISDKNLVQELMMLLDQVLQRQIDINSVGKQIAEHMDFPSRIQLIHLLFGLSLADGELAELEKDAIKEVTFLLGLNENDYQSIYSSYHQKDKNAFYKILEISATADNTAVKQAYKKMALMYHPDKVAHLGPDLIKTAEEKFKIINEAYSSIRKERGF